jgi:predicted  nucleic acid-binding Zn-ribbon protein
MPHQCTSCGRAFADGSKEMLAGCPDCDGNKFQFIPQSRMNADDATTGGSPSSGAATETPTKSPSQSTPTQQQGQSPVEMTPSSSADESTPTRATMGEDEDNAQSDARSSVVSSSELEQAKQQMAAAEQERMAQVDADAGQPSAESAGTDDAGAANTAQQTAQQEEPTSGDEMAEAMAEEHESPDLTALREELNSQFESIKIKAPGQYELNLMELYDREEYIISLREDGRYVIEMPDTWRDDDE